MNARSLSEFYRTKEWETFREIVRGERLNEKGLHICEHCGLPIVKAYDCIAHHKIELTEGNFRDVTISLNPDNIALVHHACHNAMHEKTGYKVPKVYIVWGSPLSGKSSYVDSVCKYGDFLLDIDRLWAAVSGRPEYEKPNRIKENVFALRDASLTMIEQRRGYWQTAYVVGGYALPSERERLAKRLNAECIFIDTPKEECYQRLEDCRDRRKKSEWEKYIAEWWDTYERFRAVQSPPS